MRNFNFREKLTQFARGRYGVDQLNTTLMVLAFILIILDAFFHTSFISLIALIIISLSIFRTYSRNQSKRIRENQKFLNLFKPVRKFFSIQKMKFRERKTKRFRTCPNCKVVIRTSKKRGTRVLTCPRCKTEFKAHIFL
ncbi:MAG: hypothetical protein PQJ46_03810 [Spirochaetales bacterium]|nr:hypothetical protein [Spirochaetales bacterium]